MNHSLFQQARTPDYEEAARELRAKVAAAHSADRSPEEKAAALTAILDRCRSRLAETEKIDYFHSPAGDVARSLVAEVDAALRTSVPRAASTILLRTADFHGRKWLTRPRPEIDRAGSTWLIRRWIDPKARFVFADDIAAYPDAISFDICMSTSAPSRAIWRLGCVARSRCNSRLLVARICCAFKF